MRQGQDQELAFRKFEEVIQHEMALALFSPFDIIAAFAAREQLAQPAVSRAVARIDQNIRRAVDEDEAGADQKLWLLFEFRVFQFLVGPDPPRPPAVAG